MSFKFPFTNYHELNLTWVLDQLKKLFEDSAENVTTIETYENRLSSVETELPLVSETAQDASQTAAAAATLAQQAKSTADTAQENAIQAQTSAGQARQEAQAAQTAANAATQAAQQAQATAQNFDGRITQAENDSAAALEASRSFENRVQAAITTANNAAQTATNAQGIATRADQNAALALDTLNAQRSELERIGAEQAALITEETESGKTEIENLAQSVLDSIPSDYTALSALVDKKAPVIINSASGSIVSFDDGAEDMKIQKLIVNIEPVQAGSGDPSPTNIRAISGHTGAEVTRTGIDYTKHGQTDGYRLDGSGGLISSPAYTTTDYIDVHDFEKVFFGSTWNSSGWVWRIARYNEAKTFIDETASNVIMVGADIAFNVGDAYYVRISVPYLNVTCYAYTGNQISVNWEDEAGTVYGGTLTLNPDRTGTLVVDRGITDLASLNWTELSVSYRRYTTLPASAPFNSSTNNAMFEKYQVATGYNGFLNNKNTGYRDTNGNLYVSSDDTPSGTLVYPLAEPQTHQLTAEQVSGILTTLYGVNNIWSNAGPVSVDYPADTKLYIDGKLAELQATILENI